MPETGATISLPGPPRLVPPTVAVHTSYLVGEQAGGLVANAPGDWLASRRVILASGGEPDGAARGEDRFWITTPA